MLRSALASSAEVVVLELQHVVLLDSTALGVVVQVHRALPEDRRPLVEGPAGCRCS